MPPRFAYWTILVDNMPTAFRARDAEELLPTLNQLKRKNANVVMKWFSGGQLWDSPDAARNARRRPEAPREKRGADWRPGGAHQDPRDRFKKKSRPWQNKPAGPPRNDRPWQNKPAGPPRNDRPWQNKPGGPTRSDRPWQNKPTGAPRGDRPWSKPQGAAPHGDRKPWRKPTSGPPRGDRPWRGKPPGGDRPPGGGTQKPWRDRPQGPPSGQRSPGGARSAQSLPWDAKPSGSGKSSRPRPPKQDRRPFSPPPGEPPRSAPLSNERR